MGMTVEEIWAYFSCVDKNRMLCVIASSCRCSRPRFPTWGQYEKCTAQCSAGRRHRLPQKPMTPRETEGSFGPGRIPRCTG